MVGNLLAACQVYEVLHFSLIEGAAYQHRFSNHVSPRSPVRGSGCGHRLYMEAEERVAAGALMIHPGLRIVAVVFSQTQKPNAIFIVVNNELLQAPHYEFLLLHK